jgi:FAD synthetase
MASDEGYPRRVNEPAPHRRPRYPGAHLDAEDDESQRLRSQAPRCHIFPPKKGKRVMTQGVFDLVHLGHLHYLQAARSYGDELIVVVARDETVQRNKHAPIFNEEARRELVAALAPVDSAVLGHRGDFYRIVEEIDPDIICIGYDQPYKEQSIEAECCRRGLNVKVERLPHMDYDLDSTRKVVEEIGRRIARHDLYRNVAPGRQKRLKEVGVHVEDTQKTDQAGPAAEKINRPGPGPTETHNKEHDAGDPNAKKRPPKEASA